MLEYVTKFNNITAAKGLWCLKPYQLEGTAWLLENKRCVLADDPGLGKTCQSVFAALAMLAAKRIDNVIVTANKQMVNEWQLFVNKLGLFADRFIYVTNSAASISKCEVESDYALIVDEAHNFCNYKSQRTGHLTRLAAKAKYIWLLTGTPIRNGCYGDLLGLLSVLQHPLANDPITFLDTYCLPSPFRDGEYIGCRNTERLKQAVGHLFLRRLKADVLDLPERINNVVVINDATATERFNREANQLLKDYAYNPAVCVIKARQLNAMCKLEFAISYIKKELVTKDKLVVATNVVDFVDTLKARLAAEQIECIAIHGKVSDKIRNGAADRFNTYAGKCVFLATPRTCGEGLTLTSARDLILIDYPWTATELQQLSDRIHRIGQTKPCHYHWLELTAFDNELFNLIADKSKAHCHIFDEPIVFDERMRLGGLYRAINKSLTRDVQLTLPLYQHEEQARDYIAALSDKQGLFDLLY